MLKVKKLLWWGTFKSNLLLTQKSSIFANSVTSVWGECIWECHIL